MHLSSASACCNASFCLSDQVWLPGRLLPHCFAWGMPAWIWQKRVCTRARLCICVLSVCVAYSLVVVLLCACLPACTALSPACVARPAMGSRKVFASSSCVVFESIR